MKKTIATTIIITILLTLVLAGFCSCSKVVDVNYSLDNNYDINVIDSEDYLIFEPTSKRQVAYRYGLIFYLGTVIDAECYAYLGEALARQGYLAVFYREEFAWAKYQEQEKAFDMYKNVQFFIGGHSQGGGAAIRRAQECYDTLIGAVLFDPLCSPGRHPLIDEDGNIVKDENGIDIYVTETLVDVNLPTLLLEAYKDTFWINDSFKADTLNRMNKDCLTYDKIDGTHLGFANIPDNESAQNTAQREYTIIATLAFMQSVVLDL